MVLLEIAPELLPAWKAPRLELPNEDLLGITSKNTNACLLRESSAFIRNAGRARVYSVTLISSLGII